VFVLTFSTKLCKQFTDKLTKTHRTRQKTWGNFVPQAYTIKVLEMHKATVLMI